MGFSGSKWLLISFTWLHKSWTGYLLDFTGFYWVFAGSRGVRVGLERD